MYNYQKARYGLTMNEKKNNHGGPRPGAGRPVSAEPRVARSYKLRRTTLAKLGDLARLELRSYTAVIENLIIEAHKRGKN